MHAQLYKYEYAQDGEECFSLGSLTPVDFPICPSPSTCHQNLLPVTWIQSCHSLVLQHSAMTYSPPYVLNGPFPPASPSTCSVASPPIPVGPPATPCLGQGLHSVCSYCPLWCPHKVCTPFTNLLKSNLCCENFPKPRRQAFPYSLLPQLCSHHCSHHWQEYPLMSCYLPLEELIEGSASKLRFTSPLLSHL